MRNRLKFKRPANDAFKAHSSNISSEGSIPHMRCQVYSADFENAYLIATNKKFPMQPAGFIALILVSITAIRERG